MIKSLSYDDVRLRDIPGDPLISTIIESAARQCGFGLRYDFWGVFPRRFARKSLGYILRKGESIWATVLDPAAAPELIEFLRFHESGWVELDPILAALWEGQGDILTVMEYPENISCPAPLISFREGTPTAVADCNLGAGGIEQKQYEASVVNLHLAERRRVGYSVTHWEEESPVSAAAVCDLGSRYGEISYVATLPRWEGHGFGRQMVYRCAEVLREKGRIPVIACEDHRISFYRELGFIETGTSTIFTREPED